MTKRQQNKNTSNEKLDKSNKRVFRQKTTRQKVAQNTDFSFIKNGIKRFKNIFNKEGKIR